MMNIFSDKVAIITGGASGIGRSLGEELAKRGSEIVLPDLQIELAGEVASEIRAAGGKAKTSKLDVSDFSAVKDLLGETVERTGRVDYMFNNAGISIGGPANLLTIVRLESDSRCQSPGGYQWRPGSIPYYAEARVTQLSILATVAIYCCVKTPGLFKKTAFN